MKELILTLLSDDKPGIVETLSTSVAANGGNWLESRMTQMAGKFAGIARIACEDKDEQALTEALHKLESGNLRITIDIGRGDVQVNKNQIALMVTANDRPGIVREVSNCLADLNINLEDLHTDCDAGAMSSGPIFKASFLAVMPEGLSSDQVIESLESLSDDLMVDIDTDS